MPAFPGRVIHCARDGELELQVVDTATSRSLHFGTLSRQSAMLLNAPTKLQLPYTRAMTSFLLFCPEPRHVLLIGLGGGSLAKFLLREFPNCRMDAVEPSAEVVRIAHEFFQLPHSHRLRVHVTDGESFLERPGRRAYDAILVDAFLAHGSAACMQRRRFYSACAARLRRPGGVLVANLWRGRDTGYGASLEALRQAFGSRPLRLPVGGRGNVIAIQTTQSADRPDLDTLMPRAQVLRARLDLDFPAYLRALVGHRSLWQRLVYGT